MEMHDAMARLRLRKQRQVLTAPVQPGTAEGSRRNSRDQLTCSMSLDF